MRTTGLKAIAAFAFLLALSGQAYSASFPSFSIMQGREQEIAFPNNIESLSSLSGRIADVSADGNVLTIIGHEPGAVEIEIILSGERSTRTLEVEVISLQQRATAPAVDIEIAEQTTQPFPKHQEITIDEPSVPSLPEALEPTTKPSERQAVNPPTYSIDLATATVSVTEPSGKVKLSKTERNAATLLAGVRDISLQAAQSQNSELLSIIDRDGAYDSALTMSELIERGLRLNPEVQSDTALVQQALTEVSIAKSGYWPSLQVSAGPETGAGGELGYDVVLSQMLYDWGRVDSDVNAATAKQRQQVQSLMVTRSNAALDIVEVCLDVASEYKYLDVAKFYTKGLTSLNNLVEDRAQGGYSDNAELSRIRQSLAHSMEQQAIYSGRLKDAENQYQILLHLSPISLPASILGEDENEDNFMAEAFLEQLIEESPQYLKAQQEFDLAQAKIASAEAKLKPRIVVEGTTQKREISGEMTEDSSIALRLRMDTMQGVSAFQRTEAERQGLEAAKWRMEATKRNLQRQYYSNQETRLALFERVRALQLQLEEVERVEDNYREQFVAGLRNIDDLIRVHREKYEIALQLISALSEHRRIPYRTAAELGLLTRLMGEKMSTENLQ